MTPRLSALHPLPKLVVCLVWLVAAMLIFDASFQMLTIGLAAGALILFNRTSPLLVLGLMVPFGLFGFGFLTTAVLFPADGGMAGVFAAEAPLTSRLQASGGLSAGIVLFLRAIACGMVSALFTLSTDPGDLVKALMKHWRLSPRIGFALFTALNLVPDLAREANAIRLARAMARGKPPTRFASPREIASLVLPLLAFAIRRASRAAVALEARGLGAGLPRTIVGAPRACRADAVFAVIGTTLLAAAGAWALA